MAKLAHLYDLYPVINKLFYIVHFGTQFALKRMSTARTRTRDWVYDYPCAKLGRTFSRVCIYVLTLWASSSYLCADGIFNKSIDYRNSMSWEMWHPMPFQCWPSAARSRHTRN